MNAGAQKFIDDMTKAGFAPRVEADVVVFEITPVDGAHAGRSVETGASAGELDSWPQAPPHWIHFPGNIDFPKTNTQPSPKSGWLMHSRNLHGWGDAPPAIGWASHVRATLSEATS